MPLEFRSNLLVSRGYGRNVDCTRKILRHFKKVPENKADFDNFFAQTTSVGRSAKKMFIFDEISPLSWSFFSRKT